MTSASINTHDNHFGGGSGGDGLQRVFDLFYPAQNVDAKANTIVARAITVADNVEAVKTVARRLNSSEDIVNTHCFEHKELLNQLKHEEDASVLLLRQLTHERNNILGLIDDISQQQHRFRCYMCQERVPLSLLVLNDLCRHSICRVCFSKVILEQATENILIDPSTVNAPIAIDSAKIGSTVPVATAASFTSTTKTTSKVSVLFNRYVKPTVRTAKNVRIKREPNAKAVYACLACKRRNLLSGKLYDDASSVYANTPSVLAILSPGIEENCSDVGYRIHLLDNA